MADLLSSLLQLYIICIFGRIILSYFPLQPGGLMAQVFTFLYAITEPVLGPVRRVIPPIGMFDLSPLVVIILLRVVGGALISSLS